MTLPQSNLSESVELLEKLIEFPTYEESGMKACSDFLSNKLRELGCTVTVDRLNNVYAEKTFDNGNDAFLVNSHFDTVPPNPRWVRNPLHASLEGDRLYGLGTSDDKSSVASILHALRKVEDCRFKKLEILFSNYEDNSTTLNGENWLGTPYFLAHNHLQSVSGINVEGTVEGEKFMVSLGCGGRVGFNVTTLGMEAHSSDPRKGRNAIYDMMKVIEALRKMPPAKMIVDGHEAYTELNVNMISGGTAANVVPGECEITCERRVLPNEDWDDVKAQVDRALSTVHDVELKVELRKPQRSYSIDRTHPVVTLAAQSVSKVLGYSPRFRVESGRTDSTYIEQIAGIKTVILGPGETAHIADEYVNLRRLREFDDVLIELLSSNR
jgi:acetylornithine deacetylase/succinyl-diaminopimelate desuccinylase-like protein